MQENRDLDGTVPPPPWYRNGLRFECTQCGQCCTGTTGTVMVSDDEIEALARLVSLGVEEFRAAYTRTMRRGEISLREKRNNECVFYDRGRGCSVYEQRPRQCRTWPFWDGVVATEERWDEEAADCPGMNHGKLHHAADVARTASTDGTSGFVPITSDAAPSGAPAPDSCTHQSEAAAGPVNRDLPEE